MKNSLLFFCLLSGFAVGAQNITGPTTVFVGSPQNYQFGNGTVYPGGGWYTTGGTISNQTSSGSTYNCTVTWNTYGSATLLFQDNTHTTRGSLGVTIGVGTPTATFTTSSLCGSTTVTRTNTPPSGVAWYWQTSSTGTSTANSTTVYSVTATAPLYLRAQWTANGTWSASSQNLGTITVNSNPAAPATSTDGNVISNVSVAVPLSVSTVSGATYEWFTVPTGGAVVSGSPTTNTWSPVTATNSSQAYYVESESNGCPSTTRTLVTAYVHPLPVVAVTNNGIVDDADPVTLSVSNYTYSTYAWLLNGVAISGATTPTYATTTSGTYTVQVTKNNSTAVISPAGAAVTNPYNYIISSDILIDNIMTEASANNLAIGSRSVSTQYFDGLGRPLQTVGKQASPAGYDVVQPFVYDTYGREASHYLPYVSTDNNGHYKDQSAMFASGGDYVNGFYHNASGNVASDTKPYSNVIFDNSPLLRPLKSYGPGLAWQTNNRFVQAQYLTNADGKGANQDKVILWIINTSGMPVPNAAVNGGFYPTGTLTISSTINEDGNEVRSYTDLTGNMVLKMVYLQGSTTDRSTAASSENWSRTYYIYDDLNNLRFVLQPELAKQMVLNSGYIITSADLANFGFQYNYDGRKRMISKQVPGAGVAYMIYDDRDRLVLNQDANMRALNQWIFTKYDLIDRPVMTGELDTTAVSQSTMQAAVNNFYLRTAARWGEAPGNTVHGYTSAGYPVAKDASKYMVVTYYDNYNFNNSNGTYAFLAGVLPAQTVNGFTYTPEATNFANVAGLVTGTKVKAMDTHPYWLRTVNYYDSKRRLVQSVADHQRTGTERKTVLYDFATRELAQNTTYSDNRIVWKDLVNVKTVGNELVCTTTSATWSDGAASNVLLPASTNGWVETTYVNNSATAQLVGLSSSDPDAGITSINFGFLAPLGGGACQVYENGVAKYTDAAAPVSGDVLRVERIGSTIYYKKNDIVIYTSATASSSQLLVDVSLYNGGSILNTRASFIITGTQTVGRTYQYDLAGRLLKTLHSINGATPVYLNSLKYNELGQLVEKNLHSTDNVNYKQSVDQRYTIRGWLSSVNNSQLTNSNGNDDSNDLFGMNLAYNETAGTGNNPLYTGNISAMKWSNNLAMDVVKDQAYNYSYDGFSRITTASYLRDSATWTNTRGAFSESGYSYDLNGNIKGLTRNDAWGRTMDGLSYSYSGNQLLQVADGGNKNTGFIDGTNGGNDYSYDVNGNLISDQNKLLTATNAIQYNYLNLPIQVTKNNSQFIQYVYSADGKKLAQRLFASPGNLSKTADYLDELFYENDTLRFINHEEGRVVVNMATPEYQYHLKDHLGNVRLTFTSVSVPKSYYAGFETANQVTEATEFQNYPSSSHINPVPANAHTGSNSLYLNGGIGSQVGLAKTFSVMPGDVVQIQSYAKYGTPSGTGSNLAGFAAALLSAFSLPAPLAGETGTGSAVINAWGVGEANAYGDGSTDSSDPKVFVTILVFDRNYNHLDVSYQQVTASGFMNASYTVRQPGYVYLYLSNEQPLLTDVYFDDVTITYTPGMIVQKQDYYPFGLAFNSSITPNTVRNNNLFDDGAELINDLTLGLLMTDFRMYDPSIGRFYGIDPLADVYSGQSPMVYAFNNPIAYCDPYGLEGTDPSAKMLPAVTVTASSLAPEPSRILPVVIEFQLKEPSFNKPPPNTTSVSTRFGSNRNYPQEPPKKAIFILPAVPIIAEEVLLALGISTAIVYHGNDKRNPNKTGVYRIVSTLNGMERTEKIGISTPNGDDFDGRPRRQVNFLNKNFGRFSGRVYGFYWMDVANSRIQGLALEKYYVTMYFFKNQEMPYIQSLPVPELWSYDKP